MERSNLSHRGTVKMVAKSVIVMASAVAVGCVGAFSWFTSKTTATASGVSIACEAPDGLDIAIVAHGDAAPAMSDYTEDGVIELNQDNYSFLENLSIAAVTSEGVHFYSPTLTQANGVAIPDKTNVWTEAQANKDYISFDLYMRSKTAFTVSLKSDSKLYPTSSTLIWNDGEDASAFNPSDKGNFSRDLIAGAARVSVNNEFLENQVLWIPAPNIKYNGTNNTVTLNNTSGSSFEHHCFTVSNSGATQTKTETTVTTAIANRTTDSSDYYKLGSTPVISTLGSNKVGDYYVEHVTVNIWIEGEDEEARLAFSSGHFNVELKLKAEVA